MCVVPPFWHADVEHVRVFSKRNGVLLRETPELCGALLLRAAFWSFLLEQDAWWLHGICRKQKIWASLSRVSPGVYHACVAPDDDVQIGHNRDPSTTAFPCGVVLESGLAFSDVSTKALSQLGGLAVNSQL